MGPDSKTAEHFQYPYIFPTTVQKFSSKCDGQCGTRHGRGLFFFCWKTQFAAILRLFTVSFSSFMGPKFILGSLMPLREVWTHFDMFAFFFSQFSSVKNIEKTCGARFKNCLTFPIFLHFFLPPGKNSALNTTVNTVRTVGVGTQPANVGFFLRKNIVCRSSSWAIFCWEY